MMRVSPFQLSRLQGEETASVIAKHCVHLVSIHSPFDLYMSRIITFALALARRLDLGRL